MTGQLTIDQLAERTGVTVRTIRFWAGRGLLPPPALRGRTGFYGPDHVARLELVSELSALGFTLSAIEGHLGRVPPSASAAELALQRALLTPWVPEQIEEVDRAELDRRAGRTLAAWTGTGSGCTGPARSARGWPSSTPASPSTSGAAPTRSSSNTRPRSPRT
jgi:DNA-binding transcriptional MerR regulator